MALAKFFGNSVFDFFAISLFFSHLSTSVKAIRLIMILGLILFKIFIIKL